MTATDHRVPTQPQSAGGDPTDPLVAARLVESVARYAVEIVRDARPVTALSRLAIPEVTASLARRANLTRRIRGISGRPPRVRLAITGVRTCVVNPKVVEASAVVREPDRARFIAMRWELRHTGWRITVLEIG
ncbi:Rv3235 family protein [Brachybacterium sp. JHP9]|uniref:Rv3235 family protein n=1 Tax=Brachybacterium equifaecis TaxID=2910770 RepID=A0ABT0R217_9MICO|nr:Rv3235 family protein [Brachybacterium equifaecis]MCL6423936.1 Rv3235 family protein [Brachybacterium equifaecis]